MRKIFMSAIAAATLAVAAATPAAATNFQGSYNVSANTDDGLEIKTQKLAPTNLNFNLNSVGDTFTRNLFLIWTDETTVNDDDLVPQPIEVNFSFTVPEIFGGPVSGTTEGDSYWVFGVFNTQTGSVTWNGDGALAFSGGTLGIHLSNTTFNEDTSLFGLAGLDQGKGAGSKVQATFTLLPPSTTGAGGVPEPASWALMILGFGFAGAVLRQKRRALAA